MAWVTPTTVATGDVLTAATWNQSVQANAAELAPFFSAWTSYTPTLAQGASTNISKTVTTARYLKVGRLVVMNVALTITGAGTSNNAITVSTPSGGDAAASVSGPIGFGWYVRSGVGFYWAQASFVTSTTIGLLYVPNASGAYIGTTNGPSAFATQNNDTLAFTVTYEAAS